MDHSQSRGSSISSSAGSSASADPVNYSSLLLTDQVKKREPDTGVAPGLTRSLESESESRTSNRLAHSKRVLPQLHELMVEIKQHVRDHFYQTLSLNPSRRKALLERLLIHSGGTALVGESRSENQRVNEELKSWLGELGPTKELARTIFCEEVALVYLAKAALLKNWSDRGLRKWKETDFRNVNWSLSNELKPKMPLHREGWNLMKANLYSWYEPSETLRSRIFNTLSVWNLESEGSDFLEALMDLRRDQKEYDGHFFRSFWENLENLGVDLPLPSESDDSLGIGIRQKKVVFSPTLREGAILQAAGEERRAGYTWIGTESDSFRLLFSEIVHLWSRPVSPPFWAEGSGLDIHNREQLTMTWGLNAKSSVKSYLSEVEAVDLAFVIEEKSVHTQGRSVESTRFRSELETLSYFEELRERGTSLGALQACVALSKLRPSGKLFWARETPLGPEEGSGVLGFFLDRAQLVAEWDFSGMNHALPIQSVPFPRYLYFFERQTDREQRENHRPLRVRTRGQIRSYLELPLFLQDVLRKEHEETSSRGNWKIHARPSPTPQSEWAEQWPDPTAESTIRKLELLKENSVPLGQTATIRIVPRHPDKNQWSASLSVHLPAGILLDSKRCGENCRLVAEPISDRHSPEKDLRTCQQRTGFLIVLPNKQWATAICAYLESSMVQEWLDFYSEKNKAGWLLKEQTVKFIPIPRALLSALQSPLQTQDPQARKLVQEVSDRPALITRTLSDVPLDAHTSYMRACVFVRAASTLEDLKKTQKQLFKMISPDGKIRWKHFLSVLPVKECTAFSIHPEIQLKGTLPQHLPISRMERTSDGVRFVTDSGFQLEARTGTVSLREMVWEQVADLDHPTWSEVISMVYLPRRADLAESSAAEILKSYEMQVQKLRDLRELMSVCASF